MDSRWTDEEFVQAIATVIRVRWHYDPHVWQGIGANRWDIACALAGRGDLLARLGDCGSSGADPCWKEVGVEFWPLVDPLQKDVMRKARRVYRRGLIDGCNCGCRGDWSLTAEGLALLDSASVSVANNR